MLPPEICAGAEAVLAASAVAAFKPGQTAKSHKPIKVAGKTHMTILIRLEIWGKKWLKFAFRNGIEQVVDEEGHLTCTVNGKYTTAYNA
jgi:hypothetical protein